MYLTNSEIAHAPSSQLLSTLLKGFEITLTEVGDGSGKYEWVATLSTRTVTGRGCLTSDPIANGISLAEASKIIFEGDRTPFENFINKVGDDVRQKCERTTFDKDCRKARAEGLKEEQSWCEKAYEKEGKPSRRSVYIVRVVGSNLFFGYCTFKYEDSDDFNLKIGSKDIKIWSEGYIPLLCKERYAKRFVFLERDVYDQFIVLGSQYRGLYILKEMPYATIDAFASNQYSRHDSKPNPIKKMLSWFGIAPSNETRSEWTRHDNVLVLRLEKVFSSHDDGPIDLAKAPSDIPTLKRLLFKRLKLAESDAASLSREKAAQLYLQLSRFYKDWDEVNMNNLLNRPVRSTEHLIERISRGVCSSSAEKRIASRRNELEEELVSEGFSNLLNQPQ